jgi:DNA polymerase elongation subunit (family B)
MDPDILIGYNSDYFDIPYLYYRMCNTIGKEWADQLSPLGTVNSKKYSKYFYKQSQFVDIVGVESLDYMLLHKKYSWKDEPSWKLDAIGQKYAGVNKVEFEGNLDQLFENDIHKFIEYNFMDVNILKLLDEKLQYIALTKNLSHKGKHNYCEVYSNSKTQDGAISAYLLSQGIIPPPKEMNPQKKDNYAGGYLFCPKAGLYKYMFDEDLTSLYPSIIMSVNIGKETFIGRIIDADDRNNRLGLNDLKAKDPKELLLVENNKRRQTNVEAGVLVGIIESQNLAIAANGSMFRTDKESVLSTILKKWFEERVLYKNRMKAAYKAGDKEKGEYNHLMQYTMKILLNSLYGATALPSFRYGMNFAVLSEAITLSGHRIIQESALCANRHMNKVIKGTLKLEI